MIENFITEQRRLCGIDQSLRDQAYLTERRKANLKRAILNFKQAVRLLKQGKASPGDVDAAENDALDAGADFAVIDKLRAEAADAILGEAKLAVTKEYVDKSATASLRSIKSLPARSGGSRDSSIMAAARASKNRRATHYVYPNIGKGGFQTIRTRWLITNKLSEALDPINNSGERVIAVDPDLTVRVYELNRPRATKGSTISAADYAKAAKKKG